LTAPHAVRSRYPMPNEGFDPLQYYTHKRGVVAYLPEIHLFAHKAIEKTDALYDLIDECAVEISKKYENNFPAKQPGKESS